MKTKRNLIPIWLLCGAMLPAAAQAQYNYVVTNGLITITGYTGSGGAVNIPDKLNGLTVISIGDWAFYSRNIVTSVTLPDSVTNIGFEAFDYCYYLTSVTPGTNLVSIGAAAFDSCYNMTNFTMPDTVTSIGMLAFGACNALPGVNIPKGLTNIGNYAFAGCTGMKAITVAGENPVYSSVDDVLFNKAKTTLIQCPGGKAGNYTVPDGVTSVGIFAFETCANLNSVKIPGSVTGISTGAFSQCSSLTSVCFEGNAPTPSNDSFVFYGDDKAAVYYLPKTTGWGATFDGLPTALWLPQAQTSDAAFGVQSNQFGFNIDWASGRVVVVEVATNLANPVWLPLATNTLTGGPSYFNDSQWTNSPGRYYRLRSP